jgi:hypothetical protein
MRIRLLGLTAFVRRLAARLADLAPDLHHHRVDVALDLHVARTPGRHARQVRQHRASDLVDQSIVRVTPTSSRFFSINRSCSIAVLTLT